MLWKCYTQYASKFRKLSSGHRPGKSQFAFQSQERQCQRMLKLPHNCIHLSKVQFSSVVQACPTLCDLLGFQHARLPCPSPPPKAYSNSCPFLPAILIPACASPSPAFRMMYSAYKLNKQGDNAQPWRIPFPIWNQSVVQFQLLLPNLHTVLSRGRSGGLVFPSLAEFSTVCCDPHSQRLWHSQ